MTYTGRSDMHSTAIHRLARAVAGGLGGWPFSELVRLLLTSIADEMRGERIRQVLGG